MLKPKIGIRGRVLAIALAPSLALLSAGAATSVYLFGQGVHAENWSSNLRATRKPGDEWLEALQQERRLTLLLITGIHPDPKALADQRQHVDTELFALENVPESVQKFNASLGAGASPKMYAQIATQINTTRHSADAGQLSAQAAYDFYSQLIGLGITAMNTLSQNSPDSRTTTEAGKSNTVFLALEAMLRSSALAATAATKAGMTPAQLVEYNHQVGFYHSQLASATPALGSELQSKITALMATPNWQRVTGLENAILRRGTTAPGDSDELVDVRARESDVDQVSAGLYAIWTGQEELIPQVAADAGNRTARNSAIGGGAAIAVAIAAFLIALWLSGQLVGRLKRLRGETLALADERLPQIMHMLTQSGRSDLEVEVPRLDYGTDEIGEVADAFNRAQGAAIAAAVTEAKTREGVKAVFLNIAHRSQIVVHKQLEILDKVEYGTEDPNQLNMLFQLDHLATRERRNAENLVILGGEQPSRRWSGPVSLVEIVRSAVAETEEYERIRSIQLPQLLIVGTVVADLVHLIAELVDNATAFSPPESRVEVTGNVVGRGVVVEISDQGLGMSQADLDRVNETFRTPPDFSVDTLSSDSRLGLFVVARLAVRNDISVRLTESNYGGIRAIVVIPQSLIAAEAVHEPDSEPELPEPPRPDRPADIAPEPAALDLPSIRGPGAGRPQLPRRRRQEHLAPQLVLAKPELDDDDDSAADRPRSPEQARDLLSAIENGTRQGRHVRPEPAADGNFTDERDDLR